MHALRGEKNCLQSFQQNAIYLPDTMRAAIKLFALRSRGSRRFCAVLCLALFLSLDLFASSTALHKAVHQVQQTPGTG